MIQVKHARYKPHGAYLRLSNDQYILDVDDQNGVIKGLYLKDDLYGTNFMGNEQNMRLNIWWKQRYVPQKAQRIPMYCWTGDIIFKMRRHHQETWCPMHTFLSEDIRTVSYNDDSITTNYQGNSANSGGLQNLDIRQTYQLSGDAILWLITIRNTSQEQLEIGEFGLPIIMNSNYAIGDEKQGFNHRSVDSAKYVFEQRMVTHYCVSGHSTYLYAVRPTGKGDLLTIIPQADTAFEAVIGDTYFGDGLKTEMMTATGSIFFLYAKTVLEKPWYNKHSALTLVPDQEKQFHLKIYRARDYQDLEETLYQNGNLAAQITPGMVIPRNTTGRLLLRCQNPVSSIETDDGIEVTPIEHLGDRYTYTVRLLSTGEQRVHVVYGDEEWTNLLFYGIEPLETLIKARARFIADKQQVTDPDDICQYSFRAWNNKKGALHTMEDSGGPLQGGNIEMGGSDDRNFAPALFLSGKNVYYPELKEIEVLDNFVEKFLYGKLQDPDTFEVRNSLIGPTEGSWRRWDYAWRIYNYPHTYNVYYNMYQIARLYEDQKEIPVSRTPREYLYLAYRTCLTSLLDSTYQAIYETKNYMDYHCGNMAKTHAVLNNWNRSNILDALKMEDMGQEHGILQTAIEETFPYFVEEEYPYATEYCFDQASYEGVYQIGKEAGDQALKQKTVEVVLACRHTQPLWFHYGTALRTIGNYDTPLGAIPLLDAYELSRDPFLLRIGYAGTLAVWSCVDASGTGHHTRDTRFNPPQEGDEHYTSYLNNHFSGELGVGLFGNLHLLKSYLVRDSHLGLIGYGGEVSETEENYTLKPRDGLGVRAFFEPIDVQVETMGAQMKLVTISKNKGRITIVCCRPYPHTDTGRFCLKGMPPGQYTIKSSNQGQGINVDDDNMLECLVALAPEETVVQIWQTSLNDA